MMASYYSHSWRPQDVDLNLCVWEEIAPRCSLLVDANRREDGKAPSYYINKLEEFARRSDIFIAVLTHREPDREKGPREGGRLLRCSAASLFEIRLAERARRPRLVLYDNRTGFRPAQSGDCLYLPF